ncbi:helix-turn-helix domain-containing protein [Novosphingobium sp.]|uniref:helix-turn-helix domain-containing protein n=1 Tax=Novosphingobium sp. TaxID=1874826 RepID=UPI002639FF6C|nr:helix-turn-helix domain-containing protein [Novosphingobium sp.]
MTHAAHRRPPKHRPPSRLPAFHPVPLRGRADGWTPRRQAAFIGHLAQTGSVAAAARAVGMARETAYRLRRRTGAEGFAAAWDAALGQAAAALTPSARKVTVAALLHRIEQGRLRPVLSRGRFSHIVEKADNMALLVLVARFIRSDARARQAGQAARTKMPVKCQHPCPCPPLPPI